MSFGMVAAAYLGVAGSVSGQRLALGFGEGSGTVVADSSGNGNTFTLSSGAAWTTGHTGGGIVGTTGYAYGDFGGGSVWNEWTIMCWLRRVNDTDCIVWGSSDDQLQLGIENSGSAGRVAAWSDQQSDGVIYNEPVVPLNTWTHIAITNTSSDGLTLYVNGVLIYGSLAHKSHSLNPASAFAFGASGHTGGGNLQGQIDDVRVFDRALSEAEISTIMNTPVA